MTATQRGISGPRGGVAAVLWVAALHLGACAGETAEDPTGPGPRPGGEPEPAKVRFDGEAAFRVLEALVAFGPRTPGSGASEKARLLLQESFARSGAVSWRQDFQAYDTVESRHYPMVNLAFRLRPSIRRRVLLGTHYDTKRHAESETDPARRRLPMPGANNGASGVAVLVELGRIFSACPPTVGVDFVFFDGEAFGREGARDLYFRGSVHFAEHPPSFVGTQTLAAVILDMVGDRDLGIYREGLSMEFAPQLVDRVWKSARKAGAGDVFRDEIRHWIGDDHVALHRGLGLDAILLIDFDFDGGPHSLGDTPDRCSAGSLAKVGRTLARFVYDFPED
jgi:hypothetical protein